MLTCYNDEIRLSQNDLAYVGFRLSVLETLCQMETCQELDDGDVYGYLAEVPSRSRSRQPSRWICWLICGGVIETQPCMRRRLSTPPWCMTHSGRLGERLPKSQGSRPRLRGARTGPTAGGNHNPVMASWFCPRGHLVYGTQGLFVISQECTLFHPDATRNWAKVTKVVFAGSSYANSGCFKNPLLSRGLSQDKAPFS
jgi:hypothetical protein